MKSYRLTEVKSYNVPFVRLPRPVFWFNDPFEAGTWSDLHRHEHWGELAFMRSGYMVICTELGNYAAPPQRAAARRAPGRRSSRAPTPQAAAAM